MKKPSIESYGSKAQELREEQLRNMTEREKREVKLPGLPPDLQAVRKQQAFEQGAALAAARQQLETVSTIEAPDTIQTIRATTTQPTKPGFLARIFGKRKREERTEI